MKTANKVFLIMMACLLILGALSLAVGIGLGGSLTAVFTQAQAAVTRLLDSFFLFFQG
ncbi:MAG: hypothetical protein HFG45_02660 [Oscillospiraceae bacterium]|jgi:hypothetical protein|nr:hypothetical protein [Oscillospiraceae bacterium]